MKTLIYGGLSLALLCGSAMAQGAQPSPGGTAGDPAVTPFAQERDTSRPGPDDMDRYDKDRDEKGDRARRGPPHDRDRGDRHDGPRGDRHDGPRGEWKHHGPRGDWNKGDRMGDGRRGHGPGPHHSRMHGFSGEAGASFKFDRGGRGGSIEIQCAAGESTEACVEAIMPLVETIMQGRDRDD